MSDRDLIEHAESAGGSGADQSARPPDLSPRQIALWLDSWFEAGQKTGSDR